VAAKQAVNQCSWSTQQFKIEGETSGLEALRLNTQWVYFLIINIFIFARSPYNYGVAILFHRTNNKTLGRCH